VIYTSVLFPAFAHVLRPGEEPAPQMHRICTLSKQDLRNDKVFDIVKMSTFLFEVGLTPGHLNTLCDPDCFGSPVEVSVAESRKKRPGPGRPERQMS
jgi:hypothetical protein